MNGIKSMIARPPCTKGVSLSLFTLLTSTYIGLVLNEMFYRNLYDIFSKMSTVDHFFVISIPFFIIATLNFLLNLLNWQYFIKPFFILLVITSALVSYAMTKYGVIFNQDMIQNIFETNVSEANSYFSLSALLWLSLTGLLPAIIILFTPIRYTSFLKQQGWRLLSLVASLIIVGIIALLFYKDYASVGRNNPTLRSVIVPTYYINNTYKYIKKAYFSKPVIYQQIGLDATLSPITVEHSSTSEKNTKPTLFFLLVGETARSQNYALNGYNKPTNQYTADLDVISFQNVHSCGTATAISVPCMFSNLGRSDYNEAQAKNQDNALDILQRAGVEMLWKENDGGCKGVCDRIPTVTLNVKEKNGLCNGSTCYDGAFLLGLENDIQNISGSKMIALHLIGSHGPTYYLRYPKEMRTFVPDCQRSDIENCTQQELINTYDNTILYTDFVISEIINMLKKYEDKYNVALLYLSDHGESLGENGLYLHGTPYSLAPEYQTKIPMITWFSDGFAKENNLDLLCLKERAKTESFSHDNLFSSLLGIMNVKTSVYQPELDIFNRCRRN
ncbi:MAG: phosphoethanolamine transferase [Plesiomonas sp.]|uniref:phosphoethanolamine transferase n=1 Tax=Plesiomonas sp. TaxID=2486279 RepID=UPI003F3D06D2